MSSSLTGWGEEPSLLEGASPDSAGAIYIISSTKIMAEDMFQKLTELSQYFNVSQYFSELLLILATIIIIITL